MFKYIGIIFRLVPMIIWNYFTWILPYSRHKEKYSLEHRYQKVRQFIIKVSKKLRVEYQIEGIEYLNDDTIKMIVPNHQSFIDPIAIIVHSEKPVSFIAKIEIKKMPVVGRVFKIIDGEFVDRKDLLQQFRILKIMEKSLLNKEHNWLIFPEGTRNKDIKGLKLNEYHAGTFKMAMNENINVLPVVIDGTYRALDPKVRMKKYPVKIKVNPPISNSEIKAKNTQEYRDYIYKLTLDTLDDMRK